MTQRSPAFWLLVIGGPFVAVSGLMCGAGVILACAGLFGQSSSSTVEAKTYTREEFDAAILGRQPNDVIRLIGKPSRTEQGSKDGMSPENYKYDGAFTYYSSSVRVVDKLSGKESMWVDVHFRDGKANRVSY